MNCAEKLKKKHGAAFHYASDAAIKLLIYKDQILIKFEVPIGKILLIMRFFEQ